MNNELLLLGIAIFVPFFSLARSGWRALFLLVIPIGFIQEPIRKVVDGQPVTMQLLAVGVFGFALISAMSVFGMPTLAPASGKSRRAKHLLAGFVALTILQSFHSLVRFGTPIVPMIGLMSYLLPIPVLWVAHQFVRTAADIQRFLLLYLMIALIMTIGVIASYQGIDSSLYGQVGNTPMVVYHQAVGIVELYCGYLRSPEVAAWHAAALACVSVILAVSFKGMLVRILCPFVVLYGLMTVILTGRRKALAIMVLFAGMYLTGLLLSKRKSSRSTAVAAIVVGGLLLGGALAMAPESKGPSPHLERSATAFDDAYERFEQLGLESIKWGYYVGGPFGLGTGSGAQGTQYVEGVTMQGSAEGGLGRVILELGPLGLLLAIACVISVYKQARRCISMANRHSPELFKLTLGQIAFLGANVPIYIGAAQIFGDPFVLMILGTQMGFVLAVPRVIRVQARNDPPTQDSVGTWPDASPGRVA